MKASEWVSIEAMLDEKQRERIGLRESMGLTLAITRLCDEIGNLEWTLGDVREKAGLVMLPEVQMTKAQQDPLNVRVARARGCECELQDVGLPHERVSAWMCLDGHHRGAVLGSEVRFVGELHDYEHDTAKAVRVFDRNGLVAYRDEMGRCRVFSLLHDICRLLAWPDFVVAVWEWYYAAKAAGVEVVEP